MRSRLPLTVATAAALLVAVLVFAWRTAPQETGGLAALERDPGPADDTGPAAELELEAEPTLDELFARRSAPESLEPELAASRAVDGAPDLAAASLPDAPRVRPRGRLLDAVTQEPLPEYRFQLLDAAKVRADLTTDAEGRFESSVALRAGALQVRFFERGGDWQPLEAGPLALDPTAGEEGLSEPLALSVESGPTYRLALLPPDGPPPESLRARLAASGRGRAAANARVHAGEPPWVRLGLGLGDATAGRLTLASDDGLWVGESDVTIAPGVAPGLVGVRLERRAALSVLVVDPARAPVTPAVTQLAVEPPDGDAYRRDARTDEAGRFEHRFLRAGPAVLKVRAQRFADLEIPVRLASGETTELTLELQPLPSAGAVRGIVVSDTGAYRQDVDVVLAPKDQRDGPPPLTTRVAWSEHKGRLVGTFEFERLPPGPWRLSVGERDWFEWEPRRTEVEAPLEGLVLRVHDAVEVTDLVFDVRQPDGDPARRFDLEFESDGQRTTQRGRDGAVVFKGVPVAAALRFRIDASGRVPVLGGAEAFQSARGPDGATVRTAAITLERGWGERFRVVRADNRRPIEGAKLLADGREIGTTDAGGHAFVRAEARPRQVTVRWKDWSVQGRVELDGRRRGGVPSEREVRMRAPRRK